MNFEATALEGGFDVWKEDYEVEPSGEQVGAS